ncbi:MAG: hypothetical protein JW861_03255 [Bacteroidales bacterium]|nr:hypothetical protein [Bacteroidales bacterium]
MAQNRLIRGKEYPFRIEKSVNVAGEGEVLVLTDPFGIRHLLPAGYYRGYDLKPGTTVTCRVDKINCSGRIYLEPHHPFYSAGNIYEFRFIGLDWAVGEAACLFKDIMGKEFRLPAVLFQRIPEPGEMIPLEVERIRKGRVEIFIPLLYGSLKNHPVGSRIMLTLTGEVSMQDARRYFRLEDTEGNRFYLRRKYFRDYGWKDGNRLWCEVREDEKGMRYIEPDHPVYIPGRCYPFRIIGIERMTSPAGWEGWVAELEVSHGRSAYIPVDGPGDPEKTEVVCRVREVVRGRPQLDSAGC